MDANKRYFARLRDAVSAWHGCDCSHSDTSHIIEFRDGIKIFDGNVETFQLRGHLRAVEAYAWAVKSGKSEEYVVVLKVLPIWDASDAVRAAIAGDGTVKVCCRFAPRNQSSDVLPHRRRAAPLRERRKAP